MSYTLENLKYYAKHGSNIDVGSKVIHVNQEKYAGVYTVKSIKPGDSNNKANPGILGVDIEAINESKSHKGIPLHSLRLIG